MHPIQELFWKLPPIEYSIEAIRDQIRKSLEFRGIPAAVQASVLLRYRESNSEMSSEKPHIAPTPESVPSADFTIWNHPYMKWSNQISSGRLPPEWEEAGMKLPSAKHRKDLRMILVLSARLDHLADRVQRQLSKGALQDECPGSGGLGQIVQEALHLLLLVNFEDMLCGERQRVINALNARKQPQRRAGVIIFYSIIKKEGVEQLPQILYYLGTKRYQRIRVYKQQFVFRNLRARKVVELYKITKDREKLLWSRDYKSSTFYEWRAEALGVLKSEAEREAWEREQKARDEES